MLTAGTILGPYSIVAPLGAGGMGQVYRAHDGRLDREVAIKALPDAFATDPERLARFEREARLLASLNHPNIAAIYGVEVVGEQRYLVLEFVPGESLQARLARGALPLRESLDVCRQICLALEAAHEGGMVHRDLKPGNVMLTAAGDVKVLDFGLAKGAAATGSTPDADLWASPTISFAPSTAGVILGTAAYMSPEQARGRNVDKRTDIWSFGCVLLECLTGRPTFAGETVSDIIAKILERGPDLETLPSRTPARVRELLQRCLRKDPRERLRDLGDARLEIEKAIEELDAGPATPARTGGAGFRGLGRGAWLVAVLALALATFLAVRPRLQPDVAPPPVRFGLSRPVGQTFNTTCEPALSPDGGALAFSAIDSSGTAHLWLRRLSELEPKLVPGTTGAGMVFWSPDGRYLAFGADNRLKKVAVAGGDVEVLCAAPAPRGGAWSADGTIVFAPGSSGPLVKVSAAGGTPVAVTASDTSRGERSDRYPAFLADGKRFVFVSLPVRLGLYSVCVGSVDGMQPVKLLEASGSAVFAPPNWLVFPRGTRLMAQRFDSRRLRLEGEPLALADMPDRSYLAGRPGLCAAGNGTLAYLSWYPRANQMIWYNLDGTVSGKVPAPPGFYIYAAPSPDGSRIAYVTQLTEEDTEIWLLDCVRGTATRLRDAPGCNYWPKWSPDGRSIVYQSDREGPVSFHRLDLSGAGPEEIYHPTPVYLKTLLAWPEVGDGVLFLQGGTATGGDLWWQPLGSDRTAVPVVQTSANEGFMADVSPDGKWLLYSSDASGSLQLHARLFAGGPATQVTASGTGDICFWRRGGREILSGARGTRNVVAIPFEPGQPPRIGPERVLFELPAGTEWVSYDRHSDRFLVTCQAAKREPRNLVVLQNWTSALTKP